jgi:Domain of unknown function (DUF4326)
MPANTVKVDRSSRWGNPFKVSAFEDAQTCVEKFKHWLTDAPEGRELASDAKGELRGKNLACWCPLTAPCHADVLLHLVNA